MVNAAGEGVAGAMVVVEWGTAPTPEVAIITSSEGRFRVVLPEGEFRIAARSQAGETGTLEVEAAGGSVAAPELEIHLAAPGA